MPNVKINQSNYDNKLNDWKNSATNRGDLLYFVTDELNEKRYSAGSMEKRTYCKD